MINSLCFISAGALLLNDSVASGLLGWQPTLSLVQTARNNYRWKLGATKNSNDSQRLTQGHRSSGAKPIDPRGWPERFPAKELCSKCGLCETTFVAEVDQACAFLGPSMARIDEMEELVHGRKRQKDMSFSPGTSIEEARFGVLHEPIVLAKGDQIEDAQWTGVVTGIALSMLESKQVDAVVCIANGPATNDSTSAFACPEPILARTTNDVLKGRGVKPALAPSLKVLDEIQSDPSIRKLLFCGVGCAVQAFRAIQSQLDLEEVYVLGTNCADNSPTQEAAQAFLRDGVQIGSDNLYEVMGYEFMQDFKVHVKLSRDNAYVTKPYFSLPGTIAEDSIAPSCRACFDYTNALADVVVGYMGAPLNDDKQGNRMDQSFQTLTIRNEKGARMVKVAQQQAKLSIGEIAEGEGSHDKLASLTVASDGIVAAMVGDSVPEQGMPEWLGQIMAFGMQRLGPKGLNFAKYSIDYHVLRNFLFVLDRKDDRKTAMMTLPQNARDIVQYYEENDSSFAALVAKVLRNKKQ